MGVQDAVGQGPDLRGLPGAGLLLALRDAAVATPRRGWTTSTATARTRRSPCGFELELRRAAPRVDDHAVDAAVEPRARRRARHRLRGGRDATARATSSPRRGSATYAARARRGDARSARCTGARARRPALHAAVRLLRRHRRTRSRCSPPTSCRTEDGTGVVHMAPGFGEDDQIVCNAAGIPTICPMDEHGRFTAEVPDVGGHARLRRQPAGHPRAEGARRRRAPRRPTTTPTRTAGAATQPLVYRAISSWFVEVTEFRDRMVELNQQITLGARARQGRQLRQVAGERPRLVDQPQPVLGLADPGVEVATTRRTRASTSTARSPSSSATSASPSPTCTGPTVDDLVRPNPDDPTGASMMRRVPEVLDCWFESGSMPFAQVHYPFENAGLVRAPLPGRLHRRVHRPDPRLVLHAARAGDGAVRPAGVPQLREPRHRARRRRAKMSKSLNNYPDPTEMFDTYGADAMRWYLLSSADPARRRPAGHRGRASATPCARCCCRCGTSWYFLTLYANAAEHAGRRAHRLDRRARPLRPGQDAGRSSPT